MMAETKILIYEIGELLKLVRGELGGDISGDFLYSLVILYNT